MTPVALCEGSHSELTKVRNIRVLGVRLRACGNMDAFSPSPRHAHVPKNTVCSTLCTGGRAGAPVLDLCRRRNPGSQQSCLPHSRNDLDFPPMLGPLTLWEIQNMWPRSRREGRMRSLWSRPPHPAIGLCSSSSWDTVGPHMHDRVQSPGSMHAQPLPGTRRAYLD
jgi:hypothetical protein